MTALRRLWTGPPLAGLRDHLLETLGDREDGLWIVPTPLAAEQVSRALATRPGPRNPRVLCWDDLWRRGRSESADGPSWLSPTASRAVLNEVIERAGDEGRLGPLEPVVGLAGYRRRLQSRFQGWTRSERRPRHGAGSTAPPREAAESSLFDDYRSLLAGLNAEDEAGAAVWASRRLASGTQLWKRLEGGGPVVILGLEEPSPARWRIVERAAKTSPELHVGLVHDPADALSEVFLATAPTRSRLLEMGFEETCVRPPDDRPRGLVLAERTIFARLGGASQPIDDPSGLAIQGAPQEEGTARLVAQAVRQRLARGVPPDEILIVVRRWGDEAETIRETLRSWGIGVAAEAVTSIRREPAVSALLLAASIPLEDWETDRIVRLLRHGWVRPAWSGVARADLAVAASTIQATPVFRGREQLLRELDRIAAREELDAVERRRAADARGVAERLFDVLTPLDAPRPLVDQFDRFRRLAEQLGVERGDVDVLEPLWDALDEQADILVRLGQTDRRRSWTDAVAEIESILVDLPGRPETPGPGSIRLATVAQATGARADHMILADLVEGAFPDREAVRPFLALRPGIGPDPTSREAFSREMARFLGVLGSARAGVLLVYPTTDGKGQELLRAGFLDDLLARLTPAAEAACHTALARLHPALVDHPGLVGSGADRRVRALALAAERGEAEPLARLASDPGQRPILRGTAAALHALQRRLRGTPFGEYDGLLRDGAAVLELDDLLGPNYPFSPSQLETYLSCPFQFFCKYVLKLRVIEERDELDEDPTERGSRLHDILENFETLALQREDGQTIEEIAQMAVRTNLEREPVGATELDLGLWEIERRRIERTVGDYLVQRRTYGGGGMPTFAPVRLELDFGGDDPERPVLELSRGGRKVRLRGKIDRIDVADTEDGPRFRVIDYKSGSAPGLPEIKQGAMLQLPLYAMAVQRLLFPEGQAGLFDLGYWSLRRDGFRSVSFASWEDDQVTLVEHVLALVERLRRGEFVVQSRKDGCESYCEYRGVCRLRQVRRAAKRHPLSLPTLSAQAPRRRKPTGGRDAPEATS